MEFSENIFPTQNKNAWLALGPGPIIIYQIFSLKFLVFA